MIAETLSHSYRFELRGYGHGELYAFAAPTGPPGCAMQVLAQFIADPTHEPDGSCVEAIPPPQFLRRPLNGHQRSREESMRTLTTTIAALTAGMLLAGSAQALTPADNCEADKLKRAGPASAGAERRTPSPAV